MSSIPSAITTRKTSIELTSKSHIVKERKESKHSGELSKRVDLNIN